MPAGFFAASDHLTRKRIPLLPSCGRCGLKAGCREPILEPAGDGRRGILILGEAPGKTEDERGEPFVGKTGQHLRQVLDRLEVDMRRDCWTLNAAACRPPANKLPPQAVECCRPNVVKHVQHLRPTVIIPLGGSAVESLMGWLWREDVGPVGRWVGWQIPCRKLNAWICPAWHPSYLIRQEHGGVADMMWEAHLRAAVELTDRPWDEPVEDWTKGVEVILDHRKAAEAVERFARSRLVAFDFETNMLKPDSSKARIVACSVSDGRRTVAYPWDGDAVDATVELLRSDVPKIGYNAKFETRWLRRRCGATPRNWVWDGMLAAHALDNRPGITGLKFQAWALLGQDSWDAEVKPFLKAKDSNSENRIREVSPERLLRYCGIDSLMEFKVAKVQAKLLGMKL